MSATMIKHPTSSTPTSGRGSGTISGAAQGAAAGTAIMPGVGTVVGAVIGGIAGFLGGSQQDSAAKHANQAYQYAKMRQERAGAIQRRDILREFRAKRAIAMTSIGSEEGGRRSSAPQGAIASFGAQFGFNLGYFDADVYLQNKYQEHANKAGKKAANANMINSTISTVASAAISMRGSFTPTPTMPTGSGMPAPTSISTPYTPTFGVPTYGGAAPSIPFSGS